MQTFSEGLLQKRVGQSVFAARDRRALRQRWVALGRRLCGLLGHRLLRRGALHPCPQRSMGDRRRLLFELIDHERDLTYGIWEVPTPEEAREMLREDGQPPED